MERPAWRERARQKYIRFYSGVFNHPYLREDRPHRRWCPARLSSQHPRRLVAAARIGHRVDAKWQRSAAREARAEEHSTTAYSQRRTAERLPRGPRRVPARRRCSLRPAQRRRLAEGDEMQTSGRDAEALQIKQRYEYILHTRIWVHIYSIVLQLTL